MGTSGVPWEPDKLIIIVAIKKYKGRLTYACKDKSVNCNYATLKKYIDNDPELVELLAQERLGATEEIIDSAEETVAYAMTQAPADLGNALRSAFFVLNSKGKDRGWENTHLTSQQPITLNVVDYSKAQDKPSE